MNWDLIGDLAVLWLCIACNIYMVRGWRSRRKDRRIEQEIQKLYAYAVANCSTGYIMGVKDVADLLGIELGRTHATHMG